MPKESQSCQKICSWLEESMEKDPEHLPEHKTLGPFQDHPNPPKEKYSEKASPMFKIYIYIYIYIYINKIITNKTNARQFVI